MTTISDIFTIPTQVHQGDFVLHLTEGVTRPADTLSTYVVTPQLEVCFDQALGWCHVDRTNEPATAR